MVFSNTLTSNLEKLLAKGSGIKEIDKNAKGISLKYRANDNDGKRLVTKQNEAIAYALSRMPATYESVSSVFKHVTATNSFNIDTVLDVGAGTGAATWAVHDNIGCKDYTCLEREDEMIKIGSELMEESELSSCTKWKKFDIIADGVANQYDLVISSYMINELPKESIEGVLDQIWNATKQILIIVEPGTPKEFSNIKTIRTYLLSKNAHIIAPCPHENECKLEDNDWCQFSCRIQRSKVHKMLKDGVAPYEDEKFSYIAFSKQSVNRAQNRILRHPIINKGYSEYTICTENEIEKIKLSKKDGELYKKAKKKMAGDSLELN
ncbi:MAG: methyltransferase domain-containing protein [Clostridia bacterium]|nr:methyltransferase domain-containing protein [Clostridia bacterium]